MPRRIVNTNELGSHSRYINPLNAELNPICHLVALLGAHHILHISRIRVKVGHGLVKGKAIPLQALTGPEGSRRLRLPYFKTIGTWMVGLSALRNGRLYPPGNIPGTRFLGAESSQGPQCGRKNCVDEKLSGIEPATFRLIAQCLKQLCPRVPQDMGWTTETSWSLDKRDFSSVQTGSETHHASNSMPTGGSLPGNKAAGSWSWLLIHASDKAKNEAIHLLSHMPAQST